MRTFSSALVCLVLLNQVEAKGQTPKGMQTASNEQLGEFDPAVFNKAEIDFSSQFQDADTLAAQLNAAKRAA